MQIIITDAWLARSRALHLTGWQLVAALVAAALVLMLTAVGLYHWVFLKAAREGWPVISDVVRLVAHDEFAQQDRRLRDNLDAMARRLGEMQARMVQLESLGERVSGLAGIAPPDLKSPPGRGGVLIEGRSLTLDELHATLDDLDRVANQRVDLFTVLESRLFEQRVKTMMIPTQAPVPGVELGSGYGWRIDPMTGRSALHTGLDYAAPVGTPVLAAAGGLVVGQEFHPEYGRVIDIDHGNGLVTRYAHLASAEAKQGDLVRRGQRIGSVGNSGRSTGAHLHFEVLVQGVPQDPRKFLEAGEQLAQAGARSGNARAAVRGGTDAGARIPRR
ncbi:MAG: hypothetical protein RIQ96_2387 [Pseudomonadota bacterium]